MKEYSSESSFIRLLRAGVLLGTLIMIPGVAVCWNLLPKHHYESSFLTESPPVEAADTDLETEESPEPFVDPPFPVSIDSVDTQSSLIRSTPDSGRSPTVRSEPTMELNPSSATDPFAMTSAVPGPIKAMNWNEEDEMKAIPIPTAFEEQNVVASPSVVPTTIPVPGESPQQNFPRLESELQTLGAKYYRLEKWGSRGELFRFSCYVAASEPYSYQKLFEAVDNDGIRVMERVIADIRAWRKQ